MSRITQGQIETLRDCEAGCDEVKLRRARGNHQVSALLFQLQWIRRGADGRITLTEPGARILHAWRERIGIVTKRTD